MSVWMCGGMGQSVFGQEGWRSFEWKTRGTNAEGSADPKLTAVIDSEESPESECGAGESGGRIRVN